MSTLTWYGMLILVYQSRHKERDVVRLRLKEVAEEKGLNISQVQLGAGVSMGVARRYWYDDTDAVYLDVLDRLCDYLEVEPGELLERVESTESENAE